MRQSATLKSFGGKRGNRALRNIKAEFITLPCRCAACQRNWDRMISLASVASYVNRLLMMRRCIRHTENDRPGGVCRVTRSSIWLCFVVLTLIGGCRTKQAAAPSSAEPGIPVSHPVEREVTDFVDFTGRTDAVESVGIRGRV